MVTNNSNIVSSTGGNDPARLHIQKNDNLSLHEKLDCLPNVPGCYLFKDKKGKIIYIGKAKNLRTRVKSYFTNRDDGRNLFEKLVQSIHDVEVIVVDNEIEALILENNLIKQYKPKFNIDLKDDKIYPFLCITNELFPKVFLSRKRDNEKAKYLGPFMDVKNMRLFVRELKRIFKIRNCDYSITHDTITKKKHKVCLQYHIKQCEGPCEGLISEVEYQEKVRSIIDILNGRTTFVEERWKQKMIELADQKRFEEAAKIRDQLKVIQQIIHRQRVLSVEEYNRDVLACYREDDECCVVVLKIRYGKMIGRLHYFLMGINPEYTENEILSHFILRFYENVEVPEEILVYSNKKDWKIVSDALMKIKNVKVKIVSPLRNEKYQQCKLAYSNAKLLFQEKQIAKVKRELIPRTIQSLQSLLKLSFPPNTIECFDVSHLSGENTVASLVVFYKGKPLKSQYRHFNIHIDKKVDDLAALKEALTRRYRRLLQENKTLPDLIIIDGGKGQLRIATETLQHFQIEKIPVIGLAKRLEEIYLPNENDPILLPKTSSVLRLLQHIRDEAHRFALKHQRGKRKNSLHSILDEVEGIGPMRKNALLKKFKNIANIKNADVLEFAQTIRVSKNQAEIMLRKLHELINKQ
ncbi:MAG: excinuclease ABC subunit UvrC [bacterium]|nr:excinuclease ABC subunit UvrC [bacterium]